MLLPTARGTLSGTLFDAMRGWPATELRVEGAPDGPEDAAIALWAAYELHYGGFDDVDDGLEWHPGLLAVRAGLERDLERRLRERYVAPGPCGDFAARLFALIDGHDGPSVARHVQTGADREQVLDLLRMRSVYHRKEADPTAWAVPRLGTGPKAALVELLYDEYGAGDPTRLHSQLWAEGMAASGLRPEPGAYVDEAPTDVLEQNNAMSLFGLHRRLRGAALGHLAAFEATSSVPSRRMVQGLHRLGFPDAMVGYYAEHVEADAVHEQLAVRAVCGTLVADEPALADDVLLGAATCLDLEARVARRVLGEWGVAA